MLHEIKRTREQSGPGRARFKFTFHTGIVHQDDLLQENGRGGVQDTVYRPQQGAPSLIVKHNYNTGSRQDGASLEGLLNTSAARRRRSTKIELSCTVPEWHNRVVITSAVSPQWGVHFSRDTACVAAFELPAISERGRLCNCNTWEDFMSVSCNDYVLTCSSTCCNFPNTTVLLSELARVTGQRCWNKLSTVISAVSARDFPQLLKANQINVFEFHLFYTDLFGVFFCEFKLYSGPVHTSSSSIMDY